MKKLLKHYYLTSAVLVLFTLGAAAFVTAGEESAAITTGREFEKIELSAEVFDAELKKISNFIFSFLPFRG